MAKYKLNILDIIVAFVMIPIMCSIIPYNTLLGLTPLLMFIGVDLIWIIEKWPFYYIYDVK